MSTNVRSTITSAGVAVAVAVTTALLAAGCGGGSTPAATDGGTLGPGTGPFLPLSVGSHWTYQTIDESGVVSAKVQSVSRQEPVGGDGPYATQTAFRLVTGKRMNDPEGDLSWQALVDGRVVRYREVSIDADDGLPKNEQRWDPPRLRVDQTDAHVAANASWLEPDYVEYSTDIDSFPDGGVGADGGRTYVPDGGMTTKPEIRDVWTVLSPNEAVTVPAGRFEALVVRRVGNSGASVKVFWFARGVGKVKETDEVGTSEELTSYSIAP